MQSCTRSSAVRQHVKSRNAHRNRSNLPQEKEEELQEKQRELRQRLLVAGNAAAADALLVTPLGFDWACDFKARSYHATCQL